MYVLQNDSILARGYNVSDTMVLVTCGTIGFDAIGHATRSYIKYDY